MQNGILDLQAAVDGAPKPLRKHTPRYFSLFGLEYRFDPAATCNLFFEKLNEIFEGDTQRVDLLGEWFGYCLTNKQVSVSVRWYGAVPERNEKPLPKNQWARAGRKRKWVVRWRAPDGTRPQETFNTERDAMAVQRSSGPAVQRSKVEEFESPGPTARIKPKRVTLGEFAEEFKRLRTGPTGKRASIGALSDYVCALTKLRKSIGDDTPLECITGADVVRFFTHLGSAGGLAPATVNKVKRSLKAVFNVAKRQLVYVKVNPCEDIREDRLAETDNRYVTPEEFVKLRRACSGQRKPLWGETFITLCYTTGVRKGEAVHLSWENIAFEEEAIRIVAKKGIEGVPD